MHGIAVQDSSHALIMDGCDSQPEAQVKISVHDGCRSSDVSTSNCGGRGRKFNLGLHFLISA